MAYGAQVTMDHVRLQRDWSFRPADRGAPEAQVARPRVDTLVGGLVGADRFGRAVAIESALYVEVDAVSTRLLSVLSLSIIAEEGDPDGKGR